MDHRLNADALRNADNRKLDHRLRVDRPRKLNESSVAVADSSNRRHKANV